MANVALIFILSLFSVTALSQSTAGTEIANIQSWLNHEGQKFYKPGTGDQWVRNTSPNGDRYIKVESPVNYKASNGRNYPVVIEKTGQIDGGKIGKAVANFAKFLPPLAVGLTIYDLVCELSDICKKENADEWEVPITTGLAGLEWQINQISGWIKNGVSKTGTLQEIKQQDGCGGTFDCEVSDIYINGDQITATYDLVRKSDGASMGTFTYNKIPGGYSLPELEKVTPTESHWSEAENLLNDPRFDEPLLVNGQPVPLANLPIFGNQDPIPLSDTETVNRDSLGNITGSTRTTTTLHLTDTATETRPGSVTGTEVTTKTESDLNGQPTGTQTSASSPPPPEAPTEVTVDFLFDSVPEHDLEEQDVDFDFDYESWGDGVCPPPIQIQTSFNTFTVPTEPICDFAEGARPIILMLAGLTAMFIIAGIRNAS